MPGSILSDRDPRFTSRFWQALHKGLGTKLLMSSAFHPQTDSITERSNQTLEDMLRLYVSSQQVKWECYLHLVEFAFNNARNASMGVSPFFLCGTQPRTLLNAVLPQHATVPAATDYLRARVEALKQARVSVQEAQNRQKQQADTHRREQVFAPGDQVMLATTYLQLPGVRKLTDRWIGPFEVIKVIGPAAYQISLPLTYKIHDVFHTSALKLYRGTPPDRPAPDLSMGEPKLEVEALLRHRQVWRSWQFLVLWRGYPLHEATWEPFHNLTNCPDLLRDYIRIHSLAISGL